MLGMEILIIIGLIYNDSVTKLNSALGMFPTNVISGILGFHKREYLSQKGD